MNYVLGVDVYSQNRPGDQVEDLEPALRAARKAAQWKAVVNEGVKFVFVKASEGFYSDSFFAETWQEAKNARLLRGAYHLIHAELDIAQQANQFIDTVGADLGELPPVLDLEPVLDKKGKSHWPTGGALMACIKDWLDRVEDAFGRKPIIYTSAQIIRGFDIINPPWGMDYPVWLAQYPWMPGTEDQYYDPHAPPQWSAGYPEQPEGYKPWIFWQFTEAGKMDGFGNEDVDIDLFKGTYDDLCSFAGVNADDFNKVIDDGSDDQVIYDDTEDDTDHASDNNVIEETNDEIVYELYTVVAGDTLWAISQQFDVTIDDLVRLNNIDDPDLIYVGQVLKIRVRVPVKKVKARNSPTRNIAHPI